MFLLHKQKTQERLYYAALSKLPPSHNILASIPRRDKDKSKTEKKQIHFFCIDNELVYWNFFLDFGPLNLGQLTRFCKKLNDKLRKFPAVCFYSSTDSAKRANAVFLIGAWQMLYLDRSPEQAYAGFDKYVTQELRQQQQANGNGDNDNDLLEDASHPPVSQSQGAMTIAPLPDFHDASPCQCTYDLTVLDCLQGFAKARLHGFFDMETFDVEEYEYFEQVEVRCVFSLLDGVVLCVCVWVRSYRLCALVRVCRFFEFSSTHSRTHSICSHAPLLHHHRTAT